MQHLTAEFHNWFQIISRHLIFISTSSVNFNFTHALAKINAKEWVIWRNKSSQFLQDIAVWWIHSKNKIVPDERDSTPSSHKYIRERWAMIHARKLGLILDEYNIDMESSSKFMKYFSIWIIFYQKGFWEKEKKMF